MELVVKKLLYSISICAILLLPVNALANNARDYLPLDPGHFFMAFYYEHAFGNTYYSKGKRKNIHTNLVSNVGLIRPVYFTQIGPFTIDPQFHPARWRGQPYRRSIFRHRRPHSGCDHLVH